MAAAPTADPPWRSPSKGDDHRGRSDTGVSYGSIGDYQSTQDEIGRLRHALKALLRRDRIKLWEPPHTDPMSGHSTISPKLASEYASTLGEDEEVVVEVLELIRTMSIAKREKRKEAEQQAAVAATKDTPASPANVRTTKAKGGPRKGRSRTGPGNLFKSLKIKKKEQIAFQNEGFFLAQQAQEEEAAKQDEDSGLYFDEMTAKEQAKFDENIRKQEEEYDKQNPKEEESSSAPQKVEKRLDASRMSAGLSVYNDDSGDETDGSMTIIMAWRQGPDGLLVPDDGSVLGPIISDRQEQNSALEVGPQTKERRTMSLGRRSTLIGQSLKRVAKSMSLKRGATMHPHAAPGELLASQMLMTAEQRVAIMELVKSGGMSVDEATDYMTQQELKLARKGAKQTAEAKVNPLSDLISIMSECSADILSKDQQLDIMRRVRDGTLHIDKAVSQVKAARVRSRSRPPRPNGPPSRPAPIRPVAHSVGGNVPKVNRGPAPKKPPRPTRSASTEPEMASTDEQPKRRGRSSESEVELSAAGTTAGQASEKMESESATDSADKIQTEAEESSVEAGKSSIPAILEEENDLDDPPPAYVPLQAPESAGTSAAQHKADPNAGACTNDETALKTSDQASEEQPTKPVEEDVIKAMSKPVEEDVVKATSKPTENEAAPPETTISEGQSDKLTEKRVLAENKVPDKASESVVDKPSSPSVKDALDNAANATEITSLTQEQDATSDTTDQKLKADSSGKVADDVDKDTAGESIIGAQTVVKSEPSKGDLVVEATATSTGDQAGDTIEEKQPEKQEETSGGMTQEERERRYAEMMSGPTDAYVGKSKIFKALNPTMLYKSDTAETKVLLTAETMKGRRGLGGAPAGLSVPSMQGRHPSGDDDDSAFDYSTAIDDTNSVLSKIRSQSESVFEAISSDEEDEDEYDSEEEFVLEEDDAITKMMEERRIKRMEEEAARAAELKRQNDELRVIEEARLKEERDAFDAIKKAEKEKAQKEKDELYNEAQERLATELTFDFSFG